MNMTRISICSPVWLASMALLATGFGLVAANPARADEPADPASAGNTVSAITRPSQESKLAFALPGLVVDVAVKDGDIVKKGQVLASQDSRDAEADYQATKLDADSNDKIAYSEADDAYKKVVLARKEKMLAEHVASPSEVEEAQDAVNLTTAQLALAKTEHKQKNFEAQQKFIKLDQMKIRAPYDGIVEKVSINPGEMADPQNKDGAILIAQWNPLWVEMHLPSSEAAQLKMGQTLDTKFEGDTDWKPAKIIFFEHVDPASDTQMVRLELANPDNSHPAGLHVQVKLPNKLVASAER